MREDYLLDNLCGDKAQDLNSGISDLKLHALSSKTHCLPGISIIVTYISTTYLTEIENIKTSWVFA